MPKPQEKADAQAAKLAKREKKQARRVNQREKKQIRNTARRDVGLMMDPYMTNLDLLAGSVGSTYGGAANDIEALSKPYINQSQGIQDNYLQGVGETNALFGPSINVAENEDAGQASYLGGLAGSGNYQLAGQQQSGLDWLTKSQLESTYAERYAQDNLAQQVKDLQSKTPDLIKQRIGELRADASTQRSEDAFNSFLESQIGNMLGTVGGGVTVAGKNANDDYSPTPGPNTPTGKNSPYYNESTEGRVNFVAEDVENAVSFFDLPPWLQQYIQGQLPWDKLAPWQQKLFISQRPNLKHLMDLPPRHSQHNPNPWAINQGHP